MGDEAATPAAQSRPATVAEIVLAAAESPRQREITMQIYARLKARVDVDDVLDFIDELSHVATAQAQRTVFGGKTHGGGA
jgi:hypothetical protein